MTCFKACAASVVAGGLLTAGYGFILGGWHTAGQVKSIRSNFQSLIVESQYSGNCFGDAKFSRSEDQEKFLLITNDAELVTFATDSDWVELPDNMPHEQRARIISECRRQLNSYLEKKN